jgi:hypothetical protein
MQAPIPVANGVVLILEETREKAGRTFLKIAPIEAEVLVVVSWAEK